MTNIDIHNAEVMVLKAKKYGYKAPLARFCIDLGLNAQQLEAVFKALADKYYNEGRVDGGILADEYYNP